MSPNGIPNENFVEETAATAAAPPIKSLRVTDRIVPPPESTILSPVGDLAKPRSLEVNPRTGLDELSTGKEQSNV